MREPAAPHIEPTRGDTGGAVGEGGRAASTASRQPRFGATLERGGASFRLWAPTQPQVALLVEGEAQQARAMERDATGWHRLECADLGPGTRYRFRLADGTAVPDPASRFQPQGVHGPSELIDPDAYRWQDAAWRGRPWSQAVLYELHVGTFTAAGTFEAARARLPHLAALGVTAVQLMPVAAFPGRRGWGYDGVLPFAPAAPYGRPEDLKALVDAAHALGLMVLLDVVYNHFGPEGNYTHLYWPSLMTTRHHTPWGAAVNYDDEGSAEVREFVIENARYWLEEFHLDGLRLDAVDTIRDDSAQHLLTDLAAQTADLRPGGIAPHLVLENGENETRWLPPEGPYRAQWNDDMHHVLHVALTSESCGYYADYHGQPKRLPCALAEGFAYQGETMPYRGRPRGAPSAHVHPTAFVAFLQNHDQIGNRAHGERLSTLATPTALRAAAALYLLSPQIPMLFMGEEWGSREPFNYFVDFEEPLASAVREGRRREFAKFAQFSDAHSASIPDPTAEATFLASKLDWSVLATPEGRGSLAWYRAVLATRRSRIVPLLEPSPAATRAASPDRVAEWQCEGAAFTVTWQLHSRHLTVVANLADEPCAGAFVGEWLARQAAAELLWREGWEQDPGVAPVLPPWSVAWTLR